MKNEEIDLEKVHRPDMQWYVINTLTGQEQKVMAYIKTQVAAAEMGNDVGIVFMPTEQIIDTKGSKKRTITRKIYPGYIFVQARIYVSLDPENPSKREINTPCWRFITGVPGVIGFGNKDRMHPVPMTDREIDNVMVQTTEAKTARPRVNFKPGDIVNIIEGPFKGFKGPIHEVDPDRGKLNVSVQIFGRTTPVELEFHQAEHVREDELDQGIRG